MSYRKGMTFCSMEVIAGTLLRFRQLIWIEVKRLLCFESVSYQTIAHNFLANSSVEMISFWRALPNMQYTCSVHLLQWAFPFILDQIGFCFKIPRVSFFFFFFFLFLLLFFGRYYEETLCFKKNIYILHIALFHDLAVCNDISAHSI